RALAIYQKLADAQPAVTDFQADLANIHNNIGVALTRVGKPAEALEALRRALPIQQKLVDANPANTDFQASLSLIHNNIGLALGRQMRCVEAFPAVEAGLAIRRKLVEAYPQNPYFIELLGTSYATRGGARVHAGQPAEAAADLRRALEQWAKVP